MCFQPNTFQLVIISDASRWSTFVIFSYEKTGWDTVMTTRDSMIVYYTTQYGVKHSEALGVSGKSISFRMATLKGNTGESLLLMLADISQQSVLDFFSCCIFIL